MRSVSSVAVFASDPELRDECAAAFRALGDEAPQVRFPAGVNQLFDSLRTHAVELVLIEFPKNPREIEGLTRQIHVTSPHTAVAAIMRPEGFPLEVSEGTVLIEAMRSGVCDFLRHPISTNDLKRLLTARGESAAKQVQAAPTLGRVVSFISNKGGVGKSTLATNVAVGAARHHKLRVLLIDASLQMGVDAALLDLRPSATLTDLARESDRLDATMIQQSAASHSSGLDLLAAPADAIEAMEVDDLFLARVISMARQTYDLVVVDTFPMFDRVVIAALDLSDHVYVVLENVVPTLLGGIKLVEVLGRIGCPAERQTIVINRYQRVSGALSLDEVAARLNRPIKHVLPFDKRVVAAANSGDPVALASWRFSGFSKALARLTEDVIGAAKGNSSRTAAVAEETSASLVVAADETLRQSFLAGGLTTEEAESIPVTKSAATFHDTPELATEPRIAAGFHPGNRDVGHAEEPR